MKKIIFICLLLITSISYGQINTEKYLVGSDSILTFLSQYRNLEIIVVDSTVVDTVVLEKQSLSTTGWANISTTSNVTGAVVVSMIPTAGMGGAIYFLKDFGEGSFRLRLTDTGADASVHKVKVKVVGR